MKLRLSLRAWAGTFLDLLYPPHCAFCHAATRSAREKICGGCMKSAVRITPPACDICSAPSCNNISRAPVPSTADEKAHAWDDWDDEGADTNGEEAEPTMPSPFPPVGAPGYLCFRCRSEPPSHDGAIIPYLSRAVVRETIHRFKYQGQLHFLPTLGDWLELVMADTRVKTAYPDAIVPVPLHATRYRERGFNQAALLAGELSKRTGIPVLNALRRKLYTPSQTRLAREKRMENLRNAFELRQSVDVRNLNLLLVDDVLTTGSTINACAFPLKKAGAAIVRVATVAHG